MHNQTNTDAIKEKTEESLREDLVDLQAVRERRNEPGRPFEQFVADLKRDGLI